MPADTHPVTGVLSHVEAIYRPGERQMAIDLFEALGCKVYDTGTSSVSGSTYLSVHPDPEVRGHDNVLYLSEMPSEQFALETLLRQRLEQDAELRAAGDRYSATADTQPFALSHVALRYPSFEVIEQILENFDERVPVALKSRFRLKIFRPGDSVDLGDSIQAFVYTDIAVCGISAFGQVFELAAYADAEG